MGREGGGGGGGGGRGRGKEEGEGDGGGGKEEGIIVLYAKHAKSNSIEFEMLQKYLFFTV